ncbi:MAG: RNA polymerase sigma factor RpoD/SigA [bacterium]|nr:RNA polymerase sigma factor RpoD/SigA [bacterium]
MVSELREQSRAGEDRSLAYYYKEVERHPLLTLEQEKALAARIEQGDPKAQEELVTANLRFVIHVARNFQNQGLPMADLINEGNMGLLTAAQKFDPQKGYKFITYAVWWIRQNILKALECQTRAIRVPANIINDLNKLRKVESRLSQNLERDPDPVELAEASGLPLKKIHYTLEAICNTVSLDTPMYDSTVPLQEALPDPDMPTPEEAVIEDDMYHDVRNALDTLPERDQDILNLYFGFDNTQSATYQKIGNRLGISRERVRQIKEEALEKLRRPIHAKRLAAYCS